MVHHILIGYDGSSLRRSLGRNKEEAYFLCSSVLDTVTLSSFSSLASSLSDDGSAKRNLGRLGWMSWGSTVPAFERAVFNAPLREVLGPIETEFGYHLAYVEEKRASSFSFLGEDAFLDFLEGSEIPFLLLGHVTKSEIRIDDKSFGDIANYKEIYNNSLSKKLS